MLLLLSLLASAPATTIAEAYPPPAGAQGVEADAFGRYLQALDLHPADRPIRTHAGRVVAHDGRAVVLPLVPGDLQQCADSILRLRAEFLRGRGVQPTFHATSGDPIPWARYAGGERARAVDDRLRWSAAAPADWETWLAAVSTWAGTASLEA